MFWFRRTTTPLSVQVGVECGQSTIASQSSLRRTLSAISKLLQVGCDGGVESRAFSLLLAQQRGEALHLFVERFAVVFNGFGADVAAGSEDVAVFAGGGGGGGRAGAGGGGGGARGGGAPPGV